MKILAITHLSTLYGANRSLLNLIQGTRQDIEWIVICRGYAYSKPSLKSELNDLGIKCYNVPFRLEVHSKDANLLKRKPFFVFELVYNFIIAIVLSIYALTKKVTKIHSNSSSICLGAYISYITRKPHIWHFREFLDEDYRLQYNFGLKYLKFWADKAHLIIAISKAIQDKCVVKRRIASSCVVLYNGVISTNQVKTPGNKAKKDVFSLLVLGVLDETKNQLDAIKAVERLISQKYNVSLKIVGGKSGFYYKILTSYVQKSNLDEKITFIDYVPSPDEVISEADITLVCSKNEGMGRVTLESMA
ncbi:MAG: glycosyltransferase, partial [Pedobacter sp.]